MAQRIQARSASSGSFTGVRPARRSSKGTTRTSSSSPGQHIHPHPTLSEAVGETFLTLAGRGLHQQ